LKSVLQPFYTLYPGCTAPAPAFASDSASAPATSLLTSCYAMQDSQSSRPT